MATIGLVGGLATNAGAFYYKELVKRANDRDTNLQIILIHADLPRVLRYIAGSDRAGLAGYFAGLSTQLQAAGCTTYAIAAVAPHICIEELRPISALPIIDILELIRDFATSSSAHERFAIFGNRASIVSNVFGSIDASRVIAPEPAVIERIHEIYSGIALFGKQGAEPEYRVLDEIANALRRQGATAILLAGTDLSSFYLERPPQFPIVDAARLHIDAISSVAESA
jgi:aspartate racemase